MNRRVSYGGGQSSLGYLFGSEDDKNPPPPAAEAKQVVYSPPYGIDTGEEEKRPPNPPPRNPSSPFHDHQKATSTHNTGRTSTKVRSVPGGDSSLGYLFGEKSS